MLDNNIDGKTVIVALSSRLVFKVKLTSVRHLELMESIKFR